MSEKKRLNDQELLHVAGGKSETDIAREKCTAYNSQMKNVLKTCMSDPNCKFTPRQGKSGICQYKYD